MLLRKDIRTTNMFPNTNGEDQVCPDRQVGGEQNT